MAAARIPLPSAAFPAATSAVPSSALSPSGTGGAAGRSGGRPALPVPGACGCGAGCSCGCQSGGACQCGGACG